MHSNKVSIQCLACSPLVKNRTKHLAGLLLWIILSLFPAHVFGQKNVVPVMRSELAGIDLPANTKLDKRTIIRMAAQSLLAIEAKEQQMTLGKDFEVYQLVPAAGIADLVSNAFIQAQWDWKPLQGDKTFYAEKSDKRILVFIDNDNGECWMYLAAIASGNVINTTNEIVPDPEAIPAVGNQAGPATKTENTKTAPVTTPVSTGRFHFTTTNFDDGWTATEGANWIEVSKGNLTVLLHFANAAVDFSSGQTPIVNASAWDVLVAPRYVSKREYHAFNGNMSYMRSSATSAMLTDKQGKEHYVVMFRRGGGAFLEFIAPDRASFEKEFGMHISEANNGNLIWSDDEQWQKMDAMQGRNKFAVASADLPGHWREASSSAVQMYYAGTGNYAGMNAVSNSAEFWINLDGSYRSEHKGASGMVGNQTFFQQEYKGKYHMNGNWELSMTNRYNGKTDVFACQFEVIRGGRILHLTDKANPGLTYHLMIKQ